MQTTKHWCAEFWAVFHIGARASLTFVLFFTLPRGCCGPIRWQTTKHRRADLCAVFQICARVFRTIRSQTTKHRCVPAFVTSQGCSGQSAGKQIQRLCANICAVFTSAHKFELKSAGKQLNNGMLTFVLFFTSAEGLAAKWQARSPHWATASHCPHGFLPRKLMSLPPGAVQPAPKISSGTIHLLKPGIPPPKVCVHPAA